MPATLSSLVLCLIAGVLVVATGCTGSAPSKHEAAYRIRVDKGVVCRLSPEEVIAIVGETDVVEVRCTRADKLWYATSESGRDRRVVWVVQLERGGRIVQDSTRMIIGSGGEGTVTRGGRSPTPEPARD